MCFVAPPQCVGLNFTAQVNTLRKRNQSQCQAFFWVSSVLFHPFFFLQCASYVLFPNHDWLVANNDSPQLRATLTFRVLSSFCTPHIHNESLLCLRSLIRDAAVSSSFSSFSLSLGFTIDVVISFLPKLSAQINVRVLPLSFLSTRWIQTSKTN